MEANDYLQQVEQQQARVDQELRARRAKAKVRSGSSVRSEDEHEEYDEVLEAGPAGPVNYRITGFWRWKTVIVPPNFYVVHTRRGHAEPLHVGLGISFGYNPATDAFLVVPAAVQTLLISAKCICAERQGVLVQAYVQWIVEDVRTAYRKLDFSDASDPMRIVNIQLREQAEAAIKDKVATMPIEEVLADKQPIIDELTARLKAVAEGSREGSGATGLGLKIVTVQIKEAVVSSTRLWENLQKPFRAAREKEARLAELDAGQEVATRELAQRQARETAQIETTRHLDERRAAQEREAYDRAASERVRRHQVEQSAEQQALAERAATERARRTTEEELAVQEHELAARRLARELESLRRQIELEKARQELERLRTTAGIERGNLEHEAASVRSERDLELFRRQRQAENELSEEHVRSQLIARLPEIAAALPKPEQMRTVTIGSDGGGAVTGLLAELVQVLDGLVKRPAGSNGTGA
jgi:flotillin